MHSRNRAGQYLCHTANPLAACYLGSGPPNGTKQRREMTQSAADLLPTPSARWQAQLQAGARRVAATESWHVRGRVNRATGLVLEATGLRLAVGAACTLDRKSVG